MTGIIKIGIGAALGFAVARVIEGTALGLPVGKVLALDTILKPVRDIRLLQGNSAEALRFGVVIPAPGTGFFASER